MNPAFERAKNMLQITSVVLRKFQAFIDDGIEPSHIEALKTQPQSFRAVDKVREISTIVDDSTLWEYNFFYSVGARLVKETEGDSDGGSEDDSEHVLLEISATFNAVYSSKEKLDRELLEAFSEENVGYHVWPYWREFVQSSCYKLDVPPLQTPLYFCGPNETDKSDA